MKKPKYIDTELPLESVKEKIMPLTQPVNDECQVIVDLLKLIHEKLKAIENNTFKGY